jgi:hypothetical protein
MYPYRSGSCGPDETPLERKGVHMKKLLTVFLGLAFLVGTLGCPKKEEKKKTDPVKPAAADAGDKDAKAKT